MRFVNYAYHFLMTHSSDRDRVEEMLNEPLESEIENPTEEVIAEELEGFGSALGTLTGQAP